jgi:hypothetical protein
MFLGHYGIAFGSKRLAPRTSLGTLAFAAQWLDELWPVLLLAGVETVRAAPGRMAANNLDFVSYPWSHSLTMAIVWGALIGIAYFAARRDARVAWIVGLNVLSHWMLDLPMHGPDLPLWPGSSVRVGLGLWNSTPATLGMELLFFGGGLWLYLRGTRARDRVGSWGLWVMVVLLVAMYASGFIPAPPPSPRAIALVTLLLWLFVPWMAWVDRHRERVQAAPSV